MASVEKILLESIRGASLSTHSAAGLCTAFRSKGNAGLGGAWIGEAGRLLRGAEALCRSAAALVQSQGKVKTGTQECGVVSGAESSLDASRQSVKKKKKKKKRSKSQQTGKQNNDTGSDMVVDGGLGGGGGVLRSMEAVPNLVTPAALEELRNKMFATLGGSVNASAPAAASQSALGSPGTKPFYPVGTRVTLANLAARQDLNQQCGTTAAADGRDLERVAVLLDKTGEKVRVKYENVHLFEGGSAVS